MRLFSYVNDRLSLVAFTLGVLLTSTILQAATDQPFGYKPVAGGLTIPWEIEFGPDSLLWVTERIGLLSRIDVSTGEKHVVLDMRDVVFTKQETGMLGFCFHPNFADTPWVFVSYVGGRADSMYRAIERFTYVNDSLVDPVRIFTLDPAGIYHQGCRLFIDADRKLWATGGDTPGGYVGLEDSTLVGKLMRMNLDGSAPADNPVPGLLFWTKGHRNMQGLVQLPNGRMWSSEHGNVIEDELNLIVKGGNYGWPYVEGPCDLPDEMEYCDTAGVINPKWSTGAGTKAPSGLTYYDHDRFPSLKNSLLQAFLKNSMIMQFKLNEAGDSIVTSKEFLNASVGRIRDFAISQDGRIFFCTSNREPNGYLPFPLAEDDRILELVEYPDSSVANMEVADTLTVSAVPGYPRSFAIPISNTGTGCGSIEYCWNKEADGLLRTTQWRVPVVVIPGQMFNSDAIFEPSKDTTYGQTVIIGFDHNKVDTVVLIGNTDAGIIVGPDTTIIVYLPDTSRSVIDIVLHGVGSRATTMFGATLNTTQIGFMLDPVDSMVLEPQDSTVLRLAMQFREQGSYSCSIYVPTNSYVSPRITVLAIRTPTESVLESTGIGRLQVYPNPSQGTVTLVIADELVHGVITVTDLWGQPVWQAESYSNATVWNGTTANGSTVPAGAYLVTVRRNNIIQSSVVIMQRP